ncbi:MAG: hypothetical protein ACK4Q4_00640 [Rhodocyclaceae bacterium]
MPWDDRQSLKLGKDGIEQLLAVEDCWIAAQHELAVQRGYDFPTARVRPDGVGKVRLRITWRHSDPAEPVLEQEWCALPAEPPLVRG